MTRLATESLLRLGACFGVALVLLRWVYPWQDHYGRFNVTWEEAWKPYVAVAVAMTAAGALAFYLAAVLGSYLVQGARRWASIFITAVITYILLAVLSLLFGPIGAEIRSLQIRTTFFMEYKFLTFMFMVVPIYVPVAACVLVWKYSRTGKPKASGV